MLAMSVFFALKNAIESIADYQVSSQLNAPATPEAVLTAIQRVQTFKSKVAA